MSDKVEILQPELPTIEPAATIYSKLLAARQEFHEIKLLKSGHNKFSNYSYFQLADFMPFAMKCLDNHGLVPVVSFTEIVASMTIYDVVTGEQILITSPMSTAKLKACHEIQNLGAVQTYERRYLWLALMEVVEGDPVEETQVASELATPEQIAAMYDYAETDLMTGGQKAWIKTASDKITHDQAEYVLEKLREKEAELDD